jgi:hypothetical protein
MIIGGGLVIVVGIDPVGLPVGLAGVQMVWAFTPDAILIRNAVNKSSLFIISSPFYVVLCVRPLLGE